MHIKTLAVGMVVAATILVQSTFALPSSNLVLWLKADAGVEEATGDAAENGDFISAWRDQSGSVFDAFPKAISGNSATLYKPTFVTNAVNGRPAVHFTLGPGNAEYARLALLTPLLTGTVDFHIFAVVKLNPANPFGEQFIAGNYGVTNSGGVEFNAYLGKQNLYKGGYTSGTNAVVDGAWHLLEARRVGTTISLWFDNKLDASATVALSSIAGNIPWTIGNAGDYPAGNIGYMAEHIVYNGNLSSNDLHYVVRSLADAYDLNIIPEPSVVAFVGAVASLILFRRRR